MIDFDKAEVYVVSVDRLSPNPWNPNEMSPVVWDALGQSIARHGIDLQPIVVRPHGKKYQIIDGEHRYKWAVKMGIEEMAAVIVEVDDFEAKKLTQVLNRTRGEDDPIRLKDLIDSLLVDHSPDEVIDGLPLADQQELDDLLSTLDQSVPKDIDSFETEEGLADDDEIPDDVPSRVSRGDIWQLGNHRVMCGDSSNQKDVDRLMNGERSTLCFTSPPYSDLRTYEEGTDLDIGKLSKIFSVWPSDYFVINLGLKFKNKEIVPYWDEWIAAAKSAGLKFLSWNVWDKTMGGNVVSATNMFFTTHEWLFVFGVEKIRLNRIVPNNIEQYKSQYGDDVFEKGFISNNRDKYGEVKPSGSPAYTHHQIHSVIQQIPEYGSIRKHHPATFPVGLPEKYILSFPGENITEPFLGSGTTLIACEKTGRTCYGMELSEKYCDVVLKRWEDFTGLAAKKVD